MDLVQGSEGVELKLTDHAGRVRLTVVATESPEQIDFDSWAARYVRLAIAAYRRQHPVEEGRAA